MTKLCFRVVSEFCANESGATAIEYAMIAVGIAVAIVAAIGAVSEQVIEKFTQVEDGFH